MTAELKTQTKTAPVIQTGPAITITERASKELRTAMEGEKAAALRLGLEAGGCSGYQYSLAVAEAPAADELTTSSSGIKVFVNKEHAPIVSGLTIDFVESPMGSGFHIKNPNAKSTCGCGNSFDA